MCHHRIDLIMNKSLVSYLVLAILLSSCAFLKKGHNRAEAFANYREDLSGTIITFPDLTEAAMAREADAPSAGELAVDRDLAASLNKFRDRNRSDRNWSGFTVLVYSGVDREAAFKTRDDLYTNYEGLKVEMQFQQPRYLVKVGRFINRIEAQAYFHQLRTEFPLARIVPERFQKEGYVNPDPIQDAER
jgi:hypothetical protein